MDVLSVDEMTNTHVRIRVTYADGTGAPERLFCKLPPTDPDRRAAIAATGMGVREARFYAELASSLSLRTPAVHAARHDDATGDFVLLLEDLGESGCTMPDGTVGVTPDAVAVALEELATLHVRFEDPARRAASEARWVEPAGPGSDYGVLMLRYGLEHRRADLTDAYAAVAELYVEQRPAMQAVWHSGDHTVVHGDAHLGNLFLDSGRVGFLDWGLIMLSTPMRDVSYFLTMTMDVEDRRTHERDLLRHYLAARVALSGAPLSFDDAWRSHREQASYTVAASSPAVALPDDVAPAMRTFAAHFLARAAAAVEDLDALGAMRDAGVRTVPQR